MIYRNDFPILEFDDSKEAMIEPSRLIERKTDTEACVISFFGEAVDEMVNAQNAPIISTFVAGPIRLPIYELAIDGGRVGLVKGFLGAAGSAGQLEELIALGFSKFIVCGAAGVLQKKVQLGKIIIPDAAVRDEGVSYHYLKPSREVQANPHAIQKIEEELMQNAIPYLKGKTWTTDGFYRETKDRVNLRREEGCVTVEMEAAAYFAVAEFREVILGQILYGGDDLSALTWNARDWNSIAEVRKNLLELSLKIALNL